MGAILTSLSYYVLSGKASKESLQGRLKGFGERHLSKILYTFSLLGALEASYAIRKSVAEATAKSLGASKVTTIALAAGLIAIAVTRITNPKEKGPGEQSKAQKVLAYTLGVQIAASAALALIKESKLLYLANLSALTFAMMQNRGYTAPKPQPLPQAIASPQAARLPRVLSVRITSTKETPKEGGLLRHTATLLALFHAATSLLPPEASMKVKRVLLIPDLVQLGLSTREFLKESSIDYKKVTAATALALLGGIAFAFRFDSLLRGFKEIGRLPQGTSVTIGAPTLLKLSQGVQLAQTAVDLALLKIKGVKDPHTAGAVSRLFAFVQTARAPWAECKVELEGPYFLNYNPIRFFAFFVPANDELFTHVLEAKKLAANILSQGTWIPTKEPNLSYIVSFPSSLIPKGISSFRFEGLQKIFLRAV